MCADSSNMVNADGIGIEEAVANVWHGPRNLYY